MYNTILSEPSACRAYFGSPDRSTRQCKVFILGIYSHVAEKCKTPDKTADIFFIHTQLKYCVYGSFMIFKYTQHTYAPVSDYLILIHFHYHLNVYDNY